MNSSYTGHFDAVFLDYEGTLNDSMQSGRAYAAELAGYLGRRFREDNNGTANYGRAVVAAMEATRSMPNQFGDGTQEWPGYAEYRRRELRLWLHTLLVTAGLPVPAGDDACDLLAADLVRNVPPRFVPTQGAVEAIQALSGSGIRLYVASGATTEYTARCLRDAGLIGLFADVFGPDKLDTLKTGTAYYTKCFVLAGVEPARVCIVDDSAGPLRWALELGAAAIGLGVPAERVLAQVGQTAVHDRKRYAVISDLGELTKALTSFNF